MKQDQEKIQQESGSESLKKILPRVPSINLKYVVGEEIVRPFPWAIMVALLILVVFFIIAGMLFIQRYSPEYSVYTVQNGDTMYSLAEKFYEDRQAWSWIYEANRSTLKLRQELIPGEILRIPKQIRKKEILPDDCIAHVVVAGDTVYTLAQMYYKNPNLWKPILQANRQKFKKQQKLIPGEIIYIPKLKSMQRENAAPKSIQQPSASR